MIYLKWWKGKPYNWKDSANKILIKIWWRIQKLYRQKLREFSTTNPVLQQILKETLARRKKKKGYN